MNSYYKGHFSFYRQEALGFALFLAWMYCSMFGCGLSRDHSTDIRLSLEYIWLWSGLLEAAAGMIGLMLANNHTLAETVLYNRRFGFFALIFAVAGNVCVWYSFDQAQTLFFQTFFIGGIFTGIATAMLVVLWGTRLGTYNEAEIEFSIPASFFIAFTMYCILLVTKWHSVPFLIACLLLAFFSIFFAYQDNGNKLSSYSRATCESIATDKRESLSFLALTGVLWLQIAFFRVISTPAATGNRYTHYLIPFTCACLIALMLMLLCMRVSRYMNVSLTYRWGLPLLMLSHVPILIDYDDPTWRIVAYTINFLGMFGVQFGCWIGASKFVRRTQSCPIVVFCSLALGEGLGIGLGCGLGLFAGQLPFNWMLIVAMTVMALVLFGVMVTGFNPTWIFNRTRRDRNAPLGVPAAPEEIRTDLSDQSRWASDCVRAGVNVETGTDTSPNSDIHSAEEVTAFFRSKAADLQKKYGLTDRETEVAALMLAGRSRPYIRDELIVSLNTVHTHARNIFNKCNIHSQQELMDLARDNKA